MSMHPLALLMAGGDGANVADLFSTTLWTGDGSNPRDIVNGLDMIGKGGLVWATRRTLSLHRYLTDTERGASNYLISNETNAEAAGTSIVSDFSNSGFTVGSTLNGPPQDHVAWSFCKAPMFFDIVTYTGNGTAGRQIPHNLGVPPGMIAIKRFSGTGSANNDWPVYHRALPAPSDEYLYLNLTSGGTDTFWNNEDPTEDYFVVDNRVEVNGSGEYVAYLFAHDPSPTGVIQCGTYVGDGASPGPQIDLGWEPQWVVTRRFSSNDSWRVFDNARSPENPRTAQLLINTNSAESTNPAIFLDFNAAGFRPSGTTQVNGSGDSYVYMAIRA